MAACRPRLKGAPGSARRALFCCFPLGLGSLSPGTKFSGPVGSTRGVHARGSALTSGWWLPPAQPSSGPLWLCLRLTGAPCPRHPVPASPLTREAGLSLPPSAGESQLSLQAQHLQVCSHPAPPARSRHLLRAPRRVPRPPRLMDGCHGRVPGTWPFRQSVQSETPSSPPLHGHALCQIC